MLHASLTDSFNLDPFQVHIVGSHLDLDSKPLAPCFSGIRSFYESLPTAFSFPGYSFLGILVVVCAFLLFLFVVSSK